MKKLMNLKTVLTAALALTLLGAGALIAANKYGKPTSVIHVVTVRWKAEATPAQIDAAVRRVYHALHRSGGVIAECEFGTGARPENVWQVYQSWEEVHA